MTMAQPAPVAPPLFPVRRQAAALSPDAFRFTSLALTGRESLARGRSFTALGSLLLHGVLLAAVVLVPLLSDDIPPAADRALRAFFVTPVDAAPPPPPPPPPPAAASSARARTPVAARAPVPTRFTAPIEVPTLLEPEPALDFGVEGGVPGGVEGGVPGGVVGGIVGGLPQDAPAAAPPPAVVRIGGKLVSPRRVHVVQPVYPELAVQGRINGTVVVDAHVGVDGRVKSARMISGNTIFESAALDAVRQWRYQPLLLNGVPCEFLLVVTVSFTIRNAG
jgi:protein TonB